MSYLSLSRPLRRSTRSSGRSRRATRFALACEPLENRQLLSVAQTSLGALALSHPVAAQTQITIPTSVFAFAPTGFTAINVEIGTISGLSQFQINFTGGRSGSPFSFNEGQVFAAAFGGDEVFSLFSSSSSDSQLGTGSENVNVSTSGNAGIGGGNLGSSSNTASAAASPITALNPSLAAGKGSSSGAPIVVISVPLPVVAVHLAASAAPVTTQAVPLFLTSLDNLPTSLTHFGQFPDTQWPRPFLKAPEAEEPPPPFIDYVEPFRQVVPDRAPLGEPARRGDEADAPVEVRIRPLPAQAAPNADAVLDLAVAGLIRKSADHSSSRANDRSDGAGTDHSWNLAAVFGAGVVAAGGYHLVMRDADRFRGRSVPRWAGADRPSRRKCAFPR
jgi:hypothetical protein